MCVGLSQVREELARLNGAAMFFIKKSFSKVSILNGGFIKAARYLLEDDCRMSMENALVDLDEQSLYKALTPSGKHKMEFAFSSITQSSGQPSSIGSLFSGFGSTGGPLNAPMTLGQGTNVTKSTVLDDLSKKLTMFGSTVSALAKEKLSGTGVASGAPTPNGVNSFGTNNAMSKVSSFGKLAAAAIATVGKSVGTPGATAGADATGNIDGYSFGQVYNNQTDNPVDGTSSLSFVIDGEDDSDSDSVGSSGHGGAPSPYAGRIAIGSQKISVSKTELEKAQALAMHRLAGMQQGDTFIICKENLPGAILFPALEMHEEVTVSSGTVRELGVNTQGNQDTGGNQDNENESSKVSGPPTSPSISPDHRYLVVTRERLLVLDSGGKGVGATATVKSNNHLTELIKMTFRKRDPDLVTLFFVSATMSPPKAAVNIPPTVNTPSLPETMNNTPSLPETMNNTGEISSTSNVDAPPRVEGHENSPTQADHVNGNAIVSDNSCIDNNDSKNSSGSSTEDSNSVVLTPQQFRVSKRQDFVQVLQKNMQRFK